MDQDPFGSGIFANTESELLDNQTCTVYFFCIFILQSFFRSLPYSLHPHPGLLVDPDPRIGSRSRFDEQKLEKISVEIFQILLGKNVKSKGFYGSSDPNP